MAEINKLTNAKIYRIVSNITGENYYGSTTEPTLARRLAKHRGHYKRYLNGKFNYITSFKILETNDYDIVLVEKLDNCETKDELHARERFYIEHNECVNKNIAGRTRKQHYLDNKQKLQQQMKEYYNDNKQILLEHLNCECGKQYTNTNKLRHNKSTKHINYIKNQIKTISNDDYNFLFECDSIALQPKTYPNIIINKST